MEFMVLYLIFIFYNLDQRPNEDSPPEEAMASFPHGKSLHDEDALFRERLRNMGKGKDK